MTSAWRSWFWNSVLFVVTAGLGGILAGVAFEEGRLRGFGSISAIGFAVAALLFGAGAVRAFFVGVLVRPDGIVVRRLERTIKIPWAEVARIGLEPMRSGAASLGGATSPAIIRRRADGREQRVELSVLGGYGIGKGPTLAERAVAGLRERWAASQAHGPTPGK